MQNRVRVTIVRNLLDQLQHFSCYYLIGFLMLLRLFLPNILHIPFFSLTHSYVFYFISLISSTLFHTVLAGKTDRFASTHRVCRTDGHTYHSIKQRCLAALQVKAIFIFLHLFTIFSHLSIF